MNKEVEKIIEEMKGIVLEFHRTAACLDDAIGALESSLLTGYCDDREWALMMTLQIQRYRMDTKFNHERHKLDQKEYELWAKLSEAIVKEEESQ